MVKMRPKISIIIPCYNCNNKISKCLISLEKQTYKNFEAIFIDDCSTDNTYSFLVNYCQKKSLQTQLLKNEINLGPSLTRKKGIGYAMGEYIAFIDSDDWMESEMLELLIKSINEYNSDIAFCDYYVVNQKGKKMIRHIGNKKLIKDNSNKIVLNVDSLACQLIKKSLFLNVEFPDIRNGEDMAIIPQLFAASKSVSYVDQPLYNYQYSNNSLSNQFTENLVVSLKQSFEVLQNSIGTLYEEEVVFLGVRNYLYGSVLVLNKVKKSRSVISKLVNEFSSQYINWYNNRYIKTLPFYKRIYLYMIFKRRFFFVKLLSLLHSFFLKL